jgi:hypothetical protein
MRTRRRALEGVRRLIERFMAGCGVSADFGQIQIVILTIFRIAQEDSPLLLPCLIARSV